MAPRPLAAMSFFSPRFVAPHCVEPGTLPWVLSTHRKAWFPVWLFADWRGHLKLGRDAWPAEVLAGILVLRWSEEGMSRRAAVRRAANDVAWRAALGLDLGGATPSERTLRDFERFLLQRHEHTHVPRYLILHEQIVRACLDAGVVGSGRAAYAVDSSPMWCYGAVRDTVRLLGDGLSSLAGIWARAIRTSVEAVAEEWEAPFIVAKSTKGGFAINWRDESAQARVISKVAERVTSAVADIRRRMHEARPSLRRAILRRCRHLLRVVTNDLEQDAQGNLVVAERVAADRLLSFTDPEARHGRKSKSQTFEGFKVHVLGDVVSGLLLSLTVTKGNTHDGEPAHRLMRRAKDLVQDLDAVLGDTAYGGARLRHIARRTSSITLISPPPPVADRGAKVAKADFLIDFQAQTATCPGNVTTADRRFVLSSEHGTYSPIFIWEKKTCDACPLSADCRGKSTQARRLLLHPYEKELRAAREEWENAQVRARYRTRTQCERLVNEIVRHGARKARAFGLKGAQLQAHAIAMTCNLRLLARALAAKAQHPPAHEQSAA